ncbi:MAG: hypothetical protein ACFCU3_04490 [Verrucomicrobiales bacterium]
MDRFEDWIFSPQLLFEVRSAIDTELCIRDGKIWGDSENRAKWTAMLEEEAPTTIEATELVRFQRRAGALLLGDE